MLDVTGLTLLAVCALGYCFSWKKHQAEKDRFALVLLMVCGLVLRIYLASDLYLHEWDERYHALVAKNLLNHWLVPTLYDDPVLPYSIESWTTNHIWLHKQPLTLWGIAISFKLFGLSEIAVRIPSILMSTLGIWLTFSIASYLFNRRVAFIAAFLFSIHGLIMEAAGGRVATDHVDVFFLFFVTLSVYFSIRFAQQKTIAFNLLAGISIGLAILSKWLPALIVLPIWLLVIYGSRKFTNKETVLHFLVLCGITALVFLPWQIYIFNAFPQEAGWESSFNTRHFFEVLDEQSGPFYYYLTKLRIIYGELIFLALLWFFWKTYRTRSIKRAAAGIWFLVPFLFFSVAQTKMQGYLLFTSPALFMISAEFFIMLSDQESKSKTLNFFRYAALFLLIALPVRYSIERLKPFNQEIREVAWAQDLKQLNEQNYTKGLLLNYSRPVEAMFYTGLTAYDLLPDKKTISVMSAQGYTVIINEDGGLPKEIREMEGVLIMRISADE